VLHPSGDDEAETEANDFIKTGRKKSRHILKCNGLYLYLFNFIE